MSGEAVIGVITGAVGLIVGIAGRYVNVCTSLDRLRALAIPTLELA